MKSIQLHGLITFFFLLLPAHSYSMAPGTLDPSFGGGTLGPKPGTVVTDFPSSTNIDAARALIQQPDHKLVAAGFTQEAGNFKFALARYLPDGKLDTTFGPDGRVITDFGGNDRATALILQPDGKLVAAGQNTSDYALARYNTDGTLDESFGPDGRVTTDLGGNDQAEALIIQPDGKLIVAGDAGTDFALVRYNIYGTLDASFGTGGIVITDFGVGGARATALTLQPDGKLVAAGFFISDFALARYNADGTLDTSFGTGGKVITDFGTGFDAANALIIQLDGKLVAAGIAGGDFALARYLPDGKLDTSFGIGGKVTTDLGGTDRANALVLQPDGKLVAAGKTGSDFALVRYNPNGTRDTTFNPNGLMPGVVTTNLGGTDEANALAIQTEGTQLKLVAAGVSSFRFTLAQYFAVNDISPLASNVIAKYCLN